MKKLSIMIAGVAGLLAASAAQAGTLEDVRKRLYSVWCKSRRAWVL